MYGYIYETTNLINNKKYIGKHKSSEFDKNYYGSGNAIVRALNKYGKENFSVKILEEVYTNQKDLDLKEQWYIHHDNFDAVKDKNYYNYSYGKENEGWDGVNKMFKSCPEKVKIAHKKRVMTRKRNRWTMSNKQKTRIGNSNRKPNLVMKNLKYINKDGVNKRVPKEDLDLYIKDGWNIGRDCSSFEISWKHKLKNKSINRWNNIEEHNKQSKRITESWKHRTYYKKDGD